MVFRYPEEGIFEARKAGSCFKEAGGLGKNRPPMFLLEIFNVLLNQNIDIRTVGIQKAHVQRHFGLMWCFSLSRGTNPPAGKR